MRSSITTNLAITLLGVLLACHACGGSGKSTPARSVDAAPGSSGGSATGGTSTTTGGSATGGTMSTGGVPATDGMVGTGGSPGSGGGAPNTGGTQAGSGGLATGGRVSTGGNVAGSGGVVADGGVGTGGTRASGGAGGSGGSWSDPGGCSCAGGRTTLECFCKAYACTETLASYAPDAGAGLAYSTLEEYADCNLVVVTIMGSIASQPYVFDRTTGRLVGRKLNSDVAEKCPFGGESAGYTLTAGQFPDSTCVRTKCVQGTLPGIGTCP